jgi:hypothetical protein
MCKSPYVLWFGRFKGQAVEQMMFDPRGYAYLTQFILPKIKDKPSLVAHVREVLRRGESPAIKTTCTRCSLPATQIIAVGSESEGWVFESSVYCAQHCDPIFGGRAIPLSFSSLSLFTSRTDQRAFMRVLRKHCAMSGRLDAEKACRFFFGNE